jgi:hypothetical protein
MDFEDTAPLFEAIPPLFAKLMPALADLKADMGLGVALGATFLPRLPHGLLLRHRHFGGAGSPKSH